MRAKLHTTYLFKTKDPAIDYIREAFTQARAAKRSTSSIAGTAGVAPGTVSAMFYGKTRKPQFATMVRVARAIGPEAEDALVRCIKQAGRNVRVIEGGKKRA
jgi:DNA-binding phage protein